MNQPRDELYYVTVEVENRKCKGLKMLKESGVEECRLLDIRGTPEGTTRHLVSVSSKEKDKLPEKVFSDGQIQNMESETYFWFDTEGCNICETLLPRESFLISGRNVGDYTCIYSFITPKFDIFKKTISTLEELGLKIKVLEKRKLTPKRAVLTERQERVLWLALNMGFFDFPRKIKMQELADKMGVAVSTMSEIIRRGTRRILEDHFGI